MSFFPRVKTEDYVCRRIPLWLFFSQSHVSPWWNTNESLQTFIGISCLPCRIPFTADSPLKKKNRILHLRVISQTLTNELLFALVQFRDFESSEWIHRTEAHTACLMQSPSITQKERKPDNHVYEQRFKPFGLPLHVSICYIGLSGRCYPPAPARPVILSILIQLFAPIGQKVKGAD